VSWIRSLVHCDWKWHLRSNIFLENWFVLSSVMKIILCDLKVYLLHKRKILDAVCDVSKMIRVNTPWLISWSFLIRDWKKGILGHSWFLHLRTFFRSLSSAFSVQGIPAVIVVDESGEILTRDGRSEVLNLGVSAFKVIYVFNKISQLIIVCF
jgi:hypothetical protein